MWGAFSCGMRRLEDIKDKFFSKTTTTEDKNLLFYRGEIPAQPDGLFVHEIHQKWHNDFDRLEFGHSYIQWLFPIPETGQNPEAQPLGQQEAEKLRNDPEAMERFRQSYEMMLNFYGMKLVDRSSGRVDRADHWEEQFKNLNFSEHNFLRITRILKSLGELGFEHYKAPLLRFLLTEAIERRTLQNTLDSCHSYWIPTLRDQTEREGLEEFSRRSVEARQLAERTLAGLPAGLPTGAVTDQGAGSAAGQSKDQEKSSWTPASRGEDVVNRIPNMASEGLGTTHDPLEQNRGEAVRKEEAMDTTETSVSGTPQSQTVGRAAPGGQPGPSLCQPPSPQGSGGSCHDDSQDPFKNQPYD